MNTAKTPFGTVTWDGDLKEETVVKLSTGVGSREMVLGSLVAHTNGEILGYLPGNPNPAPTPEQRANLKRVADQLFGD